MSQHVLHSVSIRPEITSIEEAYPDAALVVQQSYQRGLAG
jgi:hypothetical protein